MWLDMDFFNKILKIQLKKNADRHPGEMLVLQDINDNILIYVVFLELIPISI